MDQVVGELDSLQRLAKPVASQHVATDDLVEAARRDALWIARKGAQLVAFTSELRRKLRADRPAGACQENLHCQ